MLQRPTPNAFQMFRVEARALFAGELAEAEVNPSTRRSREQRARDKEHRRDPLGCFLVWLRDSLTDKITLTLTTKQPALRDMTRDDAYFRKLLATEIARLAEIGLRAEQHDRRK
jgi:hypothetical protein